MVVPKKCTVIENIARKHAVRTLKHEVVNISRLIMQSSGITHGKHAQSSTETCMTTTLTWGWETRSYFEVIKCRKY